MRGSRELDNNAMNIHLFRAVMIFLPLNSFARAGNTITPSKQNINPHQGTVVY